MKDDTYVVNQNKDYKLKQIYKPEEILAKSQSLKGLLEPFSNKEYFGLMPRANLTDIQTFFKNFCFEGLLAIK